MSQTPALTPFATFKEELEGTVDSDAIARQAPIETPREVETSMIGKAHRPLLLHAHPTDIRKPCRLEIQRLGNGRLRQLNLKTQCLQQHGTRGLIGAGTGRHAEAKKQHANQSDPMLNPAFQAGGHDERARQVRQHGGNESNPMIGWLQGERIDTWSQGGRKGLVIACGGVGYEVQLTSGQQTRLETESRCTVWIHQVQRDDGTSLYGFVERQERDLFRTLIGVNGVGPQMALALLECCGASALVEAIVEGDLRRLTQAQGVGKRTAERLAVELRDRLSGWRSPAPDALSLVDRTDLKMLPIQGDPLEELQQTLEALGYEDLEIRRAMRAVANADPSPDPDDADAWLRQSLRWLSQASA